MSRLVRRVGPSRDGAELVGFLASDRTSFVNGAAGQIGGGSHAWRGPVGAFAIE